MRVGRRRPCFGRILDVPELSDRSCTLRPVVIHFCFVVRFALDCVYLTGLTRRIGPSDRGNARFPPACASERNLDLVGCTTNIGLKGWRHDSDEVFAQHGLVVRKFH